MTQELWNAVDRYFCDALLPADPALSGALEASAAAGLPAISVAPNQGKLLMLLAQMCGARRILEIGTLGGYSTIWLARALPRPDGEMVTLEFEPKHADVARDNLERAHLGELVDVRVGPASASLVQLVAEGVKPFDFIFIDADKVGYPEYLDWSLKLSRPGTIIVGDNMVRKGAVIDPANPDPNVQATRRFIQKVASDPRLSGTAIQTVGSKGYDGLLIARVN